MRPEPASDARPLVELTVVDGIGVILTGLEALFCLTFPVTLAPRFAAAISDFGGELPLITRLGFSGWFPIALGIVPIVLLVYGVRPKSAIRSRRRMIGLAFLTAFAGATVCLWSVYGPILDDAV